MKKRFERCEDLLHGSLSDHCHEAEIKYAYLPPAGWKPILPEEWDKIDHAKRRVEQDRKMKESGVTERKRREHADANASRIEVYTKG